MHYCGPNYKVGGKSIWEQQRENLTDLFGEEQFERVLKDIKEGKDSWVEATDEFFEQLEYEQKVFRKIVETQIKVTPEPRNKGSWKK